MSKPLRIFISSPGDVEPERRRAALVVKKLARDYARFFDIEEPYLWETEPMLASGHFQDVILPPDEADIVVLILWSRLGTSLPARTATREYRGLDGRMPVTGTEWEFEAALAARRMRGAPDLLAYRKKAPPQATYTSETDLAELREQLQKLDAFWARHFVDKGQFVAAFNQFDDLDGFESRLEMDLRALIERRAANMRAGQTAGAPAPPWLKGSPFRGLETYRTEHAAIFFGRSRATRIAVERLIRHAAEGTPFLLVLGASGSGKSSLAQAGIVPALSTRGVAPGAGAWRVAVARPGGHPDGPFMALADALTRSDALPELTTVQETSALAHHLQGAADDPGFPIVSALAVREQALRKSGDLLSHDQVNMVVVIDQLEELFTNSELTQAERDAFIRCLAGLMHSKRVYVIATMRTDYWHCAAEVPLLVEMADGHGRFDLLPPTQAEVAEMIRRPAEAAGLAFETDSDTGIRLDAALAEEASREPGALPLLSYLLDALYRKDVLDNAGSVLLYASAQSFGGLKGAIAARAESAFRELDAASQAALPALLRALVTVSTSDAPATARAIPLLRLDNGSSRAIVDKFLDPQFRLLVADGDGDGATVRLAHEALITHWERAQRQIAQDRSDLRVRSTVEEAEADWRGATPAQRSHYLLRDPKLANAIDVMNRMSDAFDPRVRGFIEASRKRARLRQRLTMAAAGTFLIVAVLASVLGVLAYQAELMANRALADLQAQTARAAAAEKMKPDQQIAAFRQYYNAALVARGVAAVDDKALQILVADDLNGDNLLDFVTLNTDICGTGGCEIALHVSRVPGQKYDSTDELFGHTDPVVLPSQHQGYKDVAATILSTEAGDRIRSLFRWDGSKYNFKHYFLCGRIEYCADHLRGPPLVIEKVENAGQLKDEKLIFIGPDDRNRRAEPLSREPEPYGKVVPRGDVKGDWFLVSCYKCEAAFTPASNVVPK